MRIDVVTIFPAYLEPLRLSLVGRARAAGIVDIAVHDLRDWTDDRHRTVDDRPYGGGAGMVMRPEPWGRALDALLGVAADAASSTDPSEARSGPTLVVPTPAGRRFDQVLAAELSRRRHLVIACGRYEGIDQRVVDYYRERVEVRELSIGDYVLAGGEAAALVVVEAVTRLLPGVVGNPASLVEESHTPPAERPCLEYPAYTRPPSWRGLEVPPDLLSGDPARIAGWRDRAAVRRTVRARPDLAAPADALSAETVGTDVALARAQPADAGELLTLTRAAGAQPPLDSTTAARHLIAESAVLVARCADRLVAAVAGRPAADGGWIVERLLVAPDLVGRGLEDILLRGFERAAPPEATSYRVDVRPETRELIRRLRRAGYRPAPDRGWARPRPSTEPAGSG